MCSVPGKHWIFITTKSGKKWGFTSQSAENAPEGTIFHVHMQGP